MCWKVSESVGSVGSVGSPPVIDENVMNVTTILKTEENLRIMQYWE